MPISQQFPLREELEIELELRQKLEKKKGGLEETTTSGQPLPKPGPLRSAHEQAGFSLHKRR